MSSITFPGFCVKSSFTYTASIANRIDAVTLTATTNHGNATVAITGDSNASTPDTADLDLSVGANTLTLTVTAEDANTTQTYTVTVTRAAEPPAPTDCPTDTDWCTTMAVGYLNSTYTGLKTEFWGYQNNVSYGDLLSATFSHTGTNYAVTQLRVFKNTFVSTNTVSGHTLSLVGNPPLPDGTLLHLGNRTFTVDTDSDGSTLGHEQWDIEDDPLNWTEGQHVTTSLKVFTESTDATLSALSIIGATGGETITLSPAFNADTFTYTASVPNRFDSVKLTATANESNATVAITSDDDTSTPDTADLDLTVGSNTLTVTVTAEDGTVLAYAITATRATTPPAPTDCPTLTTWCTTIGAGYWTDNGVPTKSESWGYNKLNQSQGEMRRWWGSNDGAGSFSKYG